MLHPEITHSLAAERERDARRRQPGCLLADVLAHLGRAQPRRRGRELFRMTGTADGEDTVDYAPRTRPVTANLSDGGADDREAGERDEIRQVEIVRGGSAGDTLKVHDAGDADRLRRQRHHPGPRRGR